MEKQCLSATVMSGTVATPAKTIKGAAKLDNALSIQLLTPQGKATSAAITDPGVIRIGSKTEVRIGNDVVFTTSAEKSMSLSQAAEWYREQAAAIAKVLARSDLPADLKMLQAYKLREAQQQGAMNALIEPGIAEEFANCFRLEPLQKMIQDVINDLKLSGKALFEAIAAKLAKVDEDIRYPAQAGGCFIKGTRVHTKEGLKPIDEIKVGDWVLSSPEDGSGSPEYKRVVRTFEHERQTIVRVTIHPEGWEPSDSFYAIVATGNHPFWVEGVGWTRADALKPQQWLRQEDGGLAYVGGVSQVYRVGKEGIGWIQDTNSLKGRGRVFDYANYAVIGESEQKKYTYLPDEILASDDPYLRVAVYNLEVEDFHTYYVGAKGFWVHNTNCEGVRLANNKGIAPAFETPRYESSATLDGIIKAMLEKGEAPNGLVVVRSPSSGMCPQYQEMVDDIKLEIPKKYLQPWLQFEDEVVRRIVDAEGFRQEYTVLFQKSPDMTIGQKNYLRVEGHEVVSGIDVFVDRKLTMGRFFPSKNGVVKAEYIGKYLNEPAHRSAQDALELLWRVTLAMEQNPSMKWRFEMPALKSSLGGDDDALPRAAGRQVEALFEAIRQGKIDFTTYAERVSSDTGELFIDIVKKTEFAGRIERIKAMLNGDDPRIELRFVEQLGPENQNVNYEGSGIGVSPLQLADIERVFAQARKYWLDAGAAPSLLEGVELAITDLADGLAGFTQGKKIALDVTGAGWGWFVDTSAGDNGEYMATAQDQVFRAPEGSPAAGKIDLLTVLIHELGHVVGLPSVVSDAGVMGQYLSPGMRRLPSAFDLAALRDTQSFVQQGMSYVTIGAADDTGAVPARAYNQAAQQTDLDGLSAFDASAWTLAGAASSEGNVIQLRETAQAQSSARQRFVVGANDRFLSFTVASTLLRDEGPQDAFEVALIDATTGLSLLEGSGLTRSDAFLNLQADGSEYKASGVTTIRNADGSGVMGKRGFPLPVRKIAKARYSMSLSL